MPNVVKGSKQERMVVVPYRPLRRVLLLGSVMGLLIGGVLAGHWVGIRSAGNTGGRLATAQQRLDVLEAENAGLKQELALRERSSVMDQQVSNEIQSTVAELREYIASLEQDVQYYRQAMTSEFEEVGLVVGEIDVKASNDPQRFHYKLVMRQQESEGQYLIGHVNVDVVGQLAGRKLSIPLRELTEDEDQLDIRLRFRYFQNIEGDLMLPPGFVPEQIEINAVATAPMAKSISKSYNWIIEGE